MHRLDTFPTEEIVQAYRNVFGSHDAPKVLSHMLFELGLFEDVPAMSAEDAALKNYASRFLRILGGGEVQRNATDAMIKQLILQPLQKKKKEDLYG